MAKNTAHESLDRLRGKPIAKIELSAARFVTNDNPQGFGHPHYTRLRDEGFACLRQHWQQAACAGYKVAAMWEPKGREPSDGAMGWVTEKGLQNNWSDAMRLSWQVELATMRAMGLEPMWYLGESYRYLDTIVDDLAFVARMGVRIVGLDAFEMLFDTPADIATATDAIQKLRTDKRTKNLTLVMEGAMKPTVTGATRANFLRNMAQLELARGSKDTLASLDPNWKKLETAPADRKLIKGSVHIVEMHGSEWSPADLSKCYAKVKTLGLVPCDSRIPLENWK